MGTILLFLLIAFIALLLSRSWPLIKLYLSFRQAREEARRRQQEYADYRRQQAYGAHSGGARRRRRPKIDPNVGEYVDFEEITTVSSSTDTQYQQTTSYVSESQVEDIEWEDVR